MPGTAEPGHSGQKGKAVPTAHGGEQESVFELPLHGTGLKDKVNDGVLCIICQACKVSGRLGTLFRLPRKNA